MTSRLNLSLSFLIGFTLGALLFAEHSDNEQSPVNTETRSEAQATAMRGMKTTTLSGHEIVKLQDENARLNAELAKLRAEGNIDQPDQSLPQNHVSNEEKLSPGKSKEAMQVITYRDIERKFMAIAEREFKHTLIQLDERQTQSRERILKQLAETQWSQSYAQKLTQYLLENDPNGLHFVNELECRGSYCKLAVTTSSPGDWNQLIRNMSETEWYNSLAYLSHYSTDSEQTLFFERFNNRDNDQ